MLRVSHLLVLHPHPQTQTTGPPPRHSILPPSTHTPAHSIVLCPLHQLKQSSELFTTFFIFYRTIYPSTTLGTGVCAFKIAIFTLDHRQFEKKAVNCNLIGPDAGAGIILLSVRGGGCSVVEYYVEVVVP